MENFDRDSDLRRRPAADLFSKMNDSAATMNLSRDSSIGSAMDTISDGNGNQIREEKAIDSNNSETKIGNVDEKKADIAKYVYRASTPAHRTVKESPLSSDAIFKQSHAGLFNLCVVVLVAVNSRLIIENLMKYGLLIRAGFWFSSRSLRDWPLLMCCLTLTIFPVGAYMVEKSAQNKFISEPVVISLHVLITTTAVLYPVFMTLRFDSALLSGITLMLFATIVWLKLVSYAHTSYDMRVLSKSADKGDVSEKSQEIDNRYDVSFKSLVYFMVAPTLCYQPSYPRTTSIRKGWVIRQFVKLVIFTGLMGFIIEQYINPIIQNSEHPLKGNFLNAIERVLKLSVPTLYVWLCMFYCFFHLWLNILAELLRFGDREFYKDWWNAKTVQEPVHKWMVRHIYFPCIRHGIPKGIAIVMTFFLSAVFHEVPLVTLTNYLQERYHNTMVGNMVFWFIFCILGQPMSVLLYYHDLINRKPIS